MTPPPILSALETCLYVDDLQAAESFYRDVLGLRLHSREEGKFVFFHLGANMLLIFDPSASQGHGHDLPPHGAQGQQHIAFAMDEAHLPAWKKHLATHQVPIECVYTWPNGQHSLYFRDPSGNSLELAPPTIWQQAPAPPDS